MTIQNQPASDREQRVIRAACTRYLYVFTRYGQPFSLSGALVIVALFWWQAGHDTALEPAAAALRQTRLVAWAAVLSALIVWQQLCDRAFRAATPEDQARPRWRFLLALELGTASTLWGVLASFLMPADSMYQVVVILAISLLTNGGLANVAVDRLMSLVWVTPQMLALIVFYLRQGDAVSLTLVVILCIDLLYLSWVERDVRRGFRERVLALSRNEKLVDEVQGARTALATSLAEHKVVFDLAMVGIAEFRAGHVVRANSQLALMLGYPEDELIGAPARRFRPPDMAPAEVARLQGAVADAIARGATFETDIAVPRKDGSALWVQLSCRAIDPADAERGLIVVFNDITDRREREAATRRLAYEDALTGLPNRRVLQDRLGVALSRARRGSDRIALLLIDLDGFKKINDTHGHEAGDEVLKIVARRLRGCVRASDTVCRLGGDEFVMLLDHPIDAEQALRVASKAITSASLPMALAGRSLAVGASIGVALAPLDDEEGDGLLRRADEAMYSAKQAGRGVFRLHAAG